MSDKVIILSDSDAEPALPTGPDRAQRNGVTGLHFERGTHGNVLAEMLGKSSPTISLRSSGCGKSFQSPKRCNGRGLIKTNYSRTRS
jgi:hypothetical protein